MNFEKLYSVIDANNDDMIKTLSEWIKTPSVKDTAKPGAPMGEDVNIMLNKAISDCQKFGFDVRNFDGYACDARMGKIDKDPLAILAHIDVVPTGDNWVKDPFGAEIVDGYMYGRGTQDDKGPAVSALYAMKAIKELGIELNREVRLILGTDEESGWECMKYYKTHCDVPNSGFSPDANFPLINTEKGMIRVDIKAVPSKNGLQVLELITGERINVIPGKCTAIVKGDEQLANRALALSKSIGCEINAHHEDGQVKLSVIGIPGHSAMPEGTKNAIGLMLKLLDMLGLEGALSTLAKFVGTESNGESLGIKCQDKTSGELTLNMGVIKVNQEEIYATFDIRVPILADHNEIFKTISATLSPCGFNCELISRTEPHHVSENSNLVQKLLKAYREETGDMSPAMSTGGGTYAKTLKEGVAFGSIFPDEQELAHQANEKCNLDNLLKNTKIMARAIVYLCTDNE